MQKNKLNINISFGFNTKRAEPLAFHLFLILKDQNPLRGRCPAQPSCPAQLPSPAAQPSCPALLPSPAAQDQCKKQNQQSMFARTIAKSKLYRQYSQGPVQKAKPTINISKDQCKKTNSTSIFHLVLKRKGQNL